MKKVFLTIAVILGGLSTFSAPAIAFQADEKATLGNDIVLEAEEGFKQIKISELPKEVLDALATDFNRATLVRVYENGNQEYKLHISVQEVTSAVHAEIVYADKDGNWINKERFFITRNNDAVASSTTQNLR